MGYFGESEKKDDGILWLLLFGLVICCAAGPVTIAEASKKSGVFKVFLWILIRAFWFSAGLLTYHLYTL